VEEVLRILEENRVYISAEKSFIVYLSIKLLEYIMNGDGISKTDKRLAVFAKLEFLNNLSALEIYLGIAG
jgi:hypothetical protein